VAKTTPWLFYQFFVYPNYFEFETHPDDVRLGFNASVAAFQQADIFYAYCERHDPSRISAWPELRDFLIFLGKSDPNFLTVQSAANVYKHLYVTGAHYEIGSPMALWGVVYPPDQVEVVLQWGESTEDEVIVRRKGKPHVSLRTALKSVVCELWPAILPEDWGRLTD
jgi:hypothetical protein